MSDQDTSSPGSNSSKLQKRPRSSFRTPGNSKRRRSSAESVSANNTFKTPRVKRRAFSKNEEQMEDDEDLDNEIFDSLVKKTWTFYRVSRLYGFEYTPVALKRYQRLLCCGIASNIVDISEDMTLSAKIVPCEEMRRNPLDDVPLRITITDVDKRAPDDKVRVVYQGIMISYASTAENVESEPGTHLPILLARGRTKEKVHKELESIFDCCIHASIFPPEEMRWISAGWTGWLPRKPGLTIELTYEWIEQRSKYTLRFPIEIFGKVFDDIHSDGGSEFSEKEMEEFHTRINQWALTTFGVRFYAFPLSLVNTSQFKFDNKGKVLFKSADVIPRMLTYFTEFCETRLKIADDIE